MRLKNRLFRCSVALTRSRSQVNMKLGGGIGVTSPASDFSGSTFELYNCSHSKLGSGRCEFVRVLDSGGRSETVFLLE